MVQNPEACMSHMTVPKHTRSSRISRDGQWATSAFQDTRCVRLCSTGRNPEKEKRFVLQTPLEKLNLRTLPTKTKRKWLRHMTLSSCFEEYDKTTLEAFVQFIIK